MPRGEPGKVSARHSCLRDLHLASKPTPEPDSEPRAIESANLESDPDTGAPVAVRVVRITVSVGITVRVGRRCIGSGVASRPPGLNLRLAIVVGPDCAERLRRTVCCDRHCGVDAERQ